ncbi:DUF7524 family protein [Halohasta salina]|uniref:DUF7524 family protein n=1 Tax=Halohasta salina TaxID=2961621 RepID=UPI0020A3C5DC|nr:hypothetical protein [Halohasta salina]
MARLSVDLNRGGLHEIAAPSDFETDGPFEIRLRNHGEAVHVHCNLDDDLSAVASLAETNHYVEPYSRRSVPVDTRRIDTPVTGRLKIVTAYGAESAYTTVTVSPPGTVTESVTVDESLAKPQREAPEPPTPRERLLAAADRGSTALVAGVTLLICATLVVAALAQNTAAFLGSVALIAALAATLAVRRQR